MKYEKFQIFLESLSTDSNKPLIEAIKQAYSACFEADMNFKIRAFNNISRTQEDFLPAMTVPVPDEYIRENDINGIRNSIIKHVINLVQNGLMGDDGLRLFLFGDDAKAISHDGEHKIDLSSRKIGGVWSNLRAGAREMYGPEVLGRAKVKEKAKVDRAIRSGIKHGDISKKAINYKERIDKSKSGMSPERQKLEKLFK